MLNVSRKFVFLLILILGCSPVLAQQKPDIGALEVSGRVQIGKNRVKLKRKRFYLVRGGLEQNKKLVDKLKTSELISRDCYYSKMKASPEFICWLKEEDCESPYCREISDEDIKLVPEFQTAFQNGLRQFGRQRSTIARSWLTTNLNPALRDGFYQQQKSLAKDILSDVKTIQSSMTDTVTVKAIFIDIPLNLTNESNTKQKSETFLISNILPIEIDDKSYTWACEVEIESNKTERLSLKVPTDDKPVKGCEVIVKDLPDCKTEDCKK